jgi:hypothetical protein
VVTRRKTAKSPSKEFAFIGEAITIEPKFARNGIRGDGKTYQERLREAACPATANTRFAPAMTHSLQLAQDTIARLSAKKDITNLYLSPLATKPQVLGCALYYLMECQDSAARSSFTFLKNTIEKLPKAYRGCGSIRLNFRPPRVE